MKEFKGKQDKIFFSFKLRVYLTELYEILNFIFMK